MPTVVDRDVELLGRIRRGVIGEGMALPGPYGPRRLTYADYTASGRSLGFIEDAIRRQVLPRYGNTHSEGSWTGSATTWLREEARRIIGECVGASDQHAVIFCGSGTTGAAAKLAALLDVARPRAPRAVVFVGPYEHHSNELIWREAPVDLVVVPADAHGRVDPVALDSMLAQYADRPLRLGSFSAGSNVTGVVTDTDALAGVLHRHGALACFDYAAAGPYLPIRMTASAPGRMDHKDAVFLSPHKFIGGPQTPGVLVVAKHLVRRAVPTVPGGGTIAYVSPAGQRYLDDPVAREEGGTPAIVESIRAGLVFALKRYVGEERIRAAESRLCQRLLRRLAAEPAIEVLGSVDAPRLPIVSFRIHHNGVLLHHHFVVALLNDVFGIQARGGCSCAGPYGHTLLRISPARAGALDAEVAQGRLGIKPGWARISLNYFFTDDLVDYLAEAVTLIARYGHRLLGEYRFSPASGAWRHRDQPYPAEPPLASLIEPGAVPEPAAAVLGEEVFADHLRAARAIFAARDDAVGTGSSGCPPSFELLRDFHLPAACIAADFAHAGVDAFNPMQGTTAI